MNVEFKNGSSIKTIESKDLTVRSNNAKVYKIDIVKFYEEYLGIKLLPYQKLLLKILERKR